MKNSETLNSSKRITVTLVVIALILSVPLIAMQFTNQVQWKPLDFVVMGTLLLTIGLGIELVNRFVKTRNARIIVIALILVILLLIWAELAVGIFGTPFAGS